ncbi:MAG: sulfite exporter TauE/SafE family protein [Candidatus Omnitrophota bacterium]|jgi:sulfite exporter TauE/SafE
MPESLYYLFLSGIILGSGPCLGFCAPILASFVAAYRPSFKMAMVSYLSFSIAKILSYMIIGGLIGIFSGFLKSGIFLGYANAINILLGVFILVMGAITIAVKEPLGSRYCSFLNRGNLKNAGLLGFLTGFSPCLPLLGILNYIIIIARSPAEGMLYALAFGLGSAISPAILLIGLSGKLAGDLSYNQKIKFLIRIVSSLVLIFLGTVILLKGFSA